MYSTGDVKQHPGRRIGEIIDGRYQLTSLIGRGGMADVFGAQDRNGGREVAIKILREVLTRDREMLGRFQREARAQEMIQHRNVALLYGGGVTSAGEPYLAMELLRGMSLHRLMRKQGPMSLLSATNYCWQALQGVAAVHQLGIYHRDLKPANIVIEPEPDGTDRAVVIDFGFAALQGASRLTKQGHVVGSLSYMAPERLSGRSSDERSDLYSMGIILYEMLVGRPPFVADQDYELINAHLDAAPCLPSEVAPDSNIPRAVEEVIMRALAKSPADRPRSAAQMARDLERATFSVD